MRANVYYNPEAFGLKVVAEIDYSSQYYEYDTRVVWQHIESGKFYTARDSGCSCPTPFEGCSSIEDLEDFNVEVIVSEVHESGRGLNDSHDFVRTIRALGAPK